MPIRPPFSLLQAESARVAAKAKLTIAADFMETPSIRELGQGKYEV
jgi:hypothetical protein